MRRKSDKKGGVAFEYLLVTTFSAIATISMIGIITTIAKNKLEVIKDELNIEVNDFELNPFHDSE